MLCMRVPLASRGYSAKKLADNMEAEIMQVILDEARESYQEEIVVELPSNTIADLESNVERAASWLQSSSSTSRSSTWTFFQRKGKSMHKSQRQGRKNG